MSLCRTQTGLEFSFKVSPFGMPTRMNQDGVWRRLCSGLSSIPLKVRYYRSVLKFVDLRRSTYALFLLLLATIVIPNERVVRVRHAIFGENFFR